MTTNPADRPLVVIAFPPMVRPRWVEKIGEAFPEVEVIAVSYDEPMEMRLARGRGDSIPVAERPSLSAEQAEAFARAEVILAFDVPADMGSLAPNLRLVQQIGAGVDHLNGAALGPNVAVTSAAGISAVPIAEFVMGRLLSVWKQFSELDAAQRDRRWVQLYGRRFAGSTIAIIGLGAIGTEVAIRASASAHGFSAFAAGPTYRRHPVWPRCSRRRPCTTSSHRPTRSSWPRPRETKPGTSSTRGRSRP